MKHKEAVASAAQKTLNLRAEFLVNLRDPLTMPPALLKAQAELDPAVNLYCWWRNLGRRRKGRSAEGAAASR